MNKVLKKLKSLIPSKRKLIQLYSALLFNANIKGFFTGDIYRGSTKKMCAPGINCYSCPGAIGACPLGSLQNALGTSSHGTIFYVIGILLLYALLLGRFICGFLCPFGLIQELLYKIKTPKLKKNKVTRILSYLKYVILVYFVVIIPVLYLLYSNNSVPVPGFCKYICPAGILEGAFGYLSHPSNAQDMAALRSLFTWKFCLTVSIILGSVFIFRLFCRFLCPLGALYGLFNHFSVFGIKLEKSKCTDCGLCVSKCKVDIRHVNDHECINCGECIEVCPTQAISWKGSKLILPPNEIENPIPVTDDSPEDIKQLAEEQKQEFLARNEKIKKRNKILKIVVSSLMLALLAFALIYYNFIDVPKTNDNENDNNNTQNETPLPPDEGNDVGNIVQKQELLIFNGDGVSEAVIDPTSYKGKIVIVSFWNYESNNSSLEALDKIATEYKEKAVVIAIHTSDNFDGACDYIKANYQNSSVIFAKDYAKDEKENICFAAYGGENGKPLTLLLNEASVIVSSEKAIIGYDALKAAVKKEIRNGDASNPPVVGNQVGNLCPSYPMDIFDENGFTGEKIDPVKTGKLTIINFWGTWCGGCVAELPYFDRIAGEYKDKINVIAVHTHSLFDTAAGYVEQYYKDSSIIFTKDNPIDPDDEYSAEVFFKKLGGGDAYPITIILDENGVIIKTIFSALTYEDLKNVVDTELNKYQD